MVLPLRYYPKPPNPNYNSARHNIKVCRVLFIKGGVRSRRADASFFMGWLRRDNRIRNNITSRVFLSVTGRFFGSRLRSLPPFFLLVFTVLRWEGRFFGPRLRSLPPFFAGSIREISWGDSIFFRRGESVMAYSWSRQQSPGWCSSTVWGTWPCESNWIGQS